MHPVTSILPHLAVSVHCWLYAYSASAAGLLVYRSPALRDTDPVFKPVLEVLRHHRWRVVLEETIPDPGMMFGRGDLTVYRPVGGSYPDEQVYLPGYVKKLQLAVGG